METEARRPPSLVGPLLLVVLGTLLLLTNLGVVSWDLWAELWKFWPLVLILLGVELLVGGRSSWGTALLVLAVFGLVALLSAAGPFWTPWTAASAATTTSAFQQEIGPARRADVRLQFGAGAFAVTSGASPGHLVEGTASGPEEVRLEPRYQLQGDTGVLELQAARRWPAGLHFGDRAAPRRVDVKLSRELPLTLDVSVGAAEGVVDLTGLNVERLRLESGAAQVRARFSDVAARSEATVKGGAASLTLEVPPDVAARITVQSGLASVDVDESRFPKVGGSQYQSPDYGTAPKQLDLRVEAGLASVTIR